MGILMRSLMGSLIGVSRFAAIATLAAIAMAAAATSARAQNYPWCALYGTPYSDTACGFVSYEQCMENVRGIGGFCQRNDWYRPPAGATGRVPTQTHY